jgi:hypothetical protein
MTLIAANSCHPAGMNTALPGSLEDDLRGLPVERILVDLGTKDPVRVANVLLDGIFHRRAEAKVRSRQVNIEN